MKARITQYIPLGASLAAWLLSLVACSTTEMTPLPAPVTAPPAYLQVVHPSGFDLGDLRAIFTTRNAPTRESLKGCDADLMKLRSMTSSQDEIFGGTRELVRHDPVKYHWCFYGKLLDLEDKLKGESYVDERQKHVLEAYSFIAPVGRAFLQEFHDSRYKRWSVRHYRKLSEWVFYRRLDLTPRASQELLEAANPLGLVRDPAESKPVLEKYNILSAEQLAAPPGAQLPLAEDPVTRQAPDMPPVAEPGPAPVPGPPPVEQFQGSGNPPVDVFPAPDADFAEVQPADPAPPVEAARSSAIPGAVEAARQPSAAETVAPAGTAPAIEAPAESSAFEAPAPRDPASMQQATPESAPAEPAADEEGAVDTSSEATLEGDSFTPSN